MLTSLLIEQHVCFCVQHFLDRGVAWDSSVVAMVPQIVGWPDIGCVVSNSSVAMMHDHSSQVERRHARRHREYGVEVYSRRVLPSNERMLADDLPTFELQHENAWPSQQLGVLYSPFAMLPVWIAYLAMVVCVTQPFRAPMVRQEVFDSGRRGWYGQRQGVSNLIIHDCAFAMVTPSCRA